MFARQEKMNTQTDALRHSSVQYCHCLRKLLGVSLLLKNTMFRSLSRCGIVRSHFTHCRRSAISRLLFSTTNHVIPSHFEHLDISFEAQNLPDMLMAKFSDDALKNQIAFVDGTTGDTKSYGRLLEQTHSFANGLIAMGIKKGDCVAIMAPTHLHYFTSFVGISLTGGFSTPINPIYTETEVNYQLDLTQAKLIITHDICEEMVIKIASERNIPVITMGNMRTDTDGGHAQGEGRVLCIDDIIAQHPATHPNVLMDPEDTLTVPFSSGTSGQPKGVKLTHKNVMSNIVQMKALDTTFTTDTGTTTATNGKTILMSSFDLVLYLELIEKHRVTRSFIVPPILLALAKHPIVDKYDMSSLKTLNCGAAPLGEETANAAATRLDCVVKQGWGMTELSPVGTMIPDAFSDPLPPVATSGMLLPGTEALILDIASGESLPFVAGEGTAEGELLIRGPQVMHSYYKNEEATQATIRPDMFMHTGDIAKFDKDGFVYITDRLKELIKYKGFQVAPAELEALINSMAEVKDCVVIPVLDDKAGEIPRAYVVAQEDSQTSLTAESVQAYVSERAAPYKQLRGGVVFVDSVPKSASGKLLRRVQIALDRGE